MLDSTVTEWYIVERGNIKGPVRNITCSLSIMFVSAKLILCLLLLRSWLPIPDSCQQGYVTRCP
jgi:hypothetical protein